MNGETMQIADERQYSQPSHPSDAGKRLGVLFLFGVGAVVTAIAYWALFTTFATYDDEGYVLISLKNYSAHGGLYHRVFSQYGPFFYLFHDIGHHVLGYEFTNTTSRLWTLIFWLICVGASTKAVWNETREVTFTGFTLLLSFFHLSIMVREPGHPGGMIAALIAVGAYWGAVLIKREAMAGLAIAVGLLGAMLILIKINVGVFFLLSAATWFSFQLRNSRHALIAAIAATAVIGIAPLSLMHDQLREDWAQTYSVLSVSASLAMMTIAWDERRSLTRWAHAWYGAGALIATAALIVMAVCKRGTSPGEMIDGILLHPLLHPGIFNFAPHWRPGSLIVGLCSLGLAAVVWNGNTKKILWLIVGLRLVLSLMLGLVSLDWLPYASHNSTISYVVPMAWIFAVRLTDDKKDKSPSIVPWLGLLLILQYLHAYPVAGSQIGWGTFLIVPLAALGLHDTKLFLEKNGKLLPAKTIGSTCLLLSALPVVLLANSGWHRYHENHELKLTGAENIHLPPPTRTAFRILTLNAQIHGDILFSLPGMYSFNEWSGLPAPTEANATHWFSLLNTSQQEEIISSLTESKRPVVIVHRQIVNALIDQKFLSSSALYDYLSENFQVSFAIEGYEFWIRKGRTIAPFGSAEFLQLKAPIENIPANKLDVTAALAAGSQISRIELATIDGRPRVLAHWDKSNGLLFGIATNREGVEVGFKTNQAWEHPLPSLVHLELLFKQPVMFDRKTNIVYLRDSTGALLAEARFIN